jgi:hypothetical protein
MQEAILIAMREMLKLITENQALIASIIAKSKADDAKKLKSDVAKEKEKSDADKKWQKEVEALLKTC